MQSSRYCLHNFIPFYVAFLIKACAKIPRGYLWFERAEEGRSVCIDGVVRRRAYHKYTRAMKRAIDSAMLGSLASAMKTFLSETILLLDTSAILKLVSMSGNWRIRANHLDI